jgi:two-component system, NarL family, response regulator DesR
MMTDPAGQLADAVREVHAGRRVIDPGLAAAAIADRVSPLTERERDVLKAAADMALRPRSPATCSLPRELSGTT